MKDINKAGHIHVNNTFWITSEVYSLSRSSVNLTYFLRSNCIDPVIHTRGSKCFACYVFEFSDISQSIHKDGF